MLQLVCPHKKCAPLHEFHITGHMLEFFDLMFRHIFCSVFSWIHKKFQPIFSAAPRSASASSVFAIKLRIGEAVFFTSIPLLHVFNSVFYNFTISNILQEVKLMARCIFIIACIVKHATHTCYISYIIVKFFDETMCFAVL